MKLKTNEISIGKDGNFYSLVKADTFTPEIFVGDGLTSLTNAEYYTIGKLCYIQIRFTMLTNGTGTDIVTIGNLPYFSKGNGTYPIIDVAINNVHRPEETFLNFNARVVPGSDTLRIYYNASDLSITPFQVKIRNFPREGLNVGSVVEISGFYLIN